MIRKRKSLDGFEKLLVGVLSGVVIFWIVIISGLIHQGSISRDATKFCILHGYDRATVGMFSLDIECVKTFTWEEWHDAE